MGMNLVNAIYLKITKKYKIKFYRLNFNRYNDQ